MRTAVCSWSLRPSGPEELASLLRELRIMRVQLALVPCVEDATRWGDACAHLRGAGVAIVSGMLATVGEDYSTLESIARTGGVRSDRWWNANLDRAIRVAEFAAAHRIALVTFHAGFIPHERMAPEPRSSTGSARSSTSSRSAASMSRSRPARRARTRCRMRWPTSTGRARA